MTDEIDLNSRINKLIDKYLSKSVERSRVWRELELAGKLKYFPNPERGRRALRLARKLIKVSDETLSTYIKEHSDAASGLAQSLLYVRGKFASREFDRPYGGAFVNFYGFRATEGYIFSGKCAGSGAKFSGNFAGGGARFCGDGAGQNAEFFGVYAGKKAKFEGNGVGIGAKFFGDYAGANAEFAGSFSGTSTIFSGHGAGMGVTFGPYAGFEVDFSGDGAGEGAIFAGAFSSDTQIYKNGAWQDFKWSG